MFSVGVERLNNTNTMPILVLNDIVKKFNENVVLNKVNFDLKPGEVHALVGENGAGKSTLIKIISGAYSKDSGELEFDQIPFEVKSPHEALKKGISTIHQEFNLVRYLDAPSNIFLGREIVNPFGLIDKKEMKKRSQALLDRIDCQINLDVPVSKLSVAEQQIIEICKALSINIKVLIMDEPTAVLSEKETEKLFQVVKSLKDSGIAIIYISHRLEELFVIADRTTVLRDGKVVGTLNSEQFNKELITKMMIGRDLSEQYPKREKGDKAETILDVRNITGGVLKDISFKLHKGELLGLYGLVGSGRTELAKSIMGLYQMDKGEVVLHGKHICNKNPNRAIRNGFALVPEDRKTQGLLLNLNNEENLTISSLKLFCKHGVLLKNRIKNYAKKMVGNLQIHPANSKVRTKELSGGNQQKVVIGKWLSKPYEVIIFDEPTRGVDVGAKVEIYKIINNILEQGIGVIMISSELPEIIGMSDRILVLREGKLMANLINESLTEETVIKYAF
jgi:ribose transport system ATP-binding protein